LPSVLCPFGQGTTAVVFVSLYIHKAISRFYFAYKNLSSQKSKNKN